MRMKGIAAAATCIALVCAAGSIWYDSRPMTNQDGTITLRMAQTSSETGAIGQEMNRFAELIQERTDGKYEIEVYHNGQLGAEIDTIEGCQMGTIDIVVVNQSTLGNFLPEFQALDIPYLITSNEQADRVFLGEIGDEFLDKLSSVQLYGLGIWESGFRNLTNSKVDVESVEDVQGLKIRTMENLIHIDFWRAMGADATPMAWSEAYTAMQQGALDGQENPSTVILTNNVAQVNDRLAITEHAYSTVFLIMSPATWASLDAETQQIFLDTMKECSIEERAINRQMDAEAVAQLQEQGMTVTYPDKQGFIDAAADLYAEWEQEYGDIIARINALADEGNEDESV